MRRYVRRRVRLPYHSVPSCHLWWRLRRRFGERPAFVDPDGAITDLRGPAPPHDEVAAGLDAVGVRAGSVVALTWRRTRPTSWPTWRRPRLGAVAAGVNPRLTAGTGPRASSGRARLVLGPRPTTCAGAGAPGAAVDARTMLSARWPSCSRRGRPVSRRAPGSPTASSRPSTRIDVGDAVGRARTPRHADAGRNPVRPRRLHDQAAVVPAARARRPTCSLAGGPPTRSTSIERERIPSIGGVAPQMALMLRDPDFDQRDLVPRADDHDGRRPVVARAGRRGRDALRRRLLDPLLVDRVRRRRHRHRVRRRRPRGAAHRRPPRAASSVSARRRTTTGRRRRGRRGLAALRRHDGRLLERPGGDRPDASPTAGCAPATSAGSTTPAASCSPGGKGDVHPRRVQRVPGRGRGGARRTTRPSTRWRWSPDPTT